jgi:hypothetical protein
MDDDKVFTTDEVVQETEGSTGQDQPQTEQPEAEQAGKPAEPLQIDPLQWLDTAKELKPEVKEALKAGFLRQADYTKKTQEIAALKRKAELFDQMQQQPTQPKQPENPEEEQIPDDPKEFLKLAIRRAKEEAVAEARAEWQQDRQLEMAERLDPRLSSDEEYATEIARIVSTNPLYRSNQMNLVEATKLAIQEHKVKNDKVRQAVIAELNEKARKSTVIPSESGSPLNTANKVQATTMQEAARLAEEELSRT